MAQKSLDAPEPAPQWVNTAYAARHLHMHEVTLRKWRVRGEGPRYQKRGRTVRYRLADLDAWLNGK